MSAEEKEEDALTRFAHSFYEKEERPRYAFTKVRLPRPDRALLGKPAHEGLRIHTTHDYHLMQKVLKRPDLFRTPIFVRKAMGRFIGFDEPALILDAGASWRALHDVLVKDFSKKAVAANILPIVAEETDATTRRQLASTKPVDISHDNRALTARVVMRIVFGETMKEHEGREITEASSVSLQSFRTPSPLTMLSRIAGEPYDHIPGVSKEIKEAERVVTGRLREVVERRRAQGPQNGDILDKLIAARGADGHNPFSDQRVMNNGLMFIVAGHETTAEAITFAMWELLKNPKELEKLRQEIDAVSGGTPRILGPDDYPNLPLARKDFREAQRMHPTAWQIGREALADCEIDAGGELGVIKFRKGDLIVGDLRLMGRDPGYFEQPNLYMPSRLDAYEKADPVGLMNFGGGPRVCIAPEMAVGEGTLFLANLFNRASMYNVTLPDHEIPAFTMRASEGFTGLYMPRHP